MIARPRTFAALCDDLLLAYSRGYLLTSVRRNGDGAITLFFTLQCSKTPQQESPTMTDPSKLQAAHDAIATLSTAYSDASKGILDAQAKGALDVAAVQAADDPAVAALQQQLADLSSKEAADLSAAKSASDAAVKVASDAADGALKALHAGYQAVRDELRAFEAALLADLPAEPA